jgi:hypothetical protein
MPWPDPSAAFQPLVDLVKIGLDRWDERQDGKRAMTAVLIGIRTELDRDWTAIRAAQEPDSGPQAINNSLAKGDLKNLAKALKDRKSLIERITACYQQMEEGRTELPPQQWSEDKAAELEDLSGLLAQASREITKMLVDEKLIVDRLTAAECRVPRVGKMLDDLGISDAERLRIIDVWTSFCDGLNAGDCRAYGKAEIESFLASNGGVLGEIDMRREARVKYPAGHSFEVTDGVFEVMIRDRLRLLYGHDRLDKPIVLDIVRLLGPESVRWTPEWRLKLAACRLWNLRIVERP